MAELVNVAWINWYLIDSLDVGIAGKTAVIGENRSGKSSILDLVQTVLTGNNRNYMRLNASSGEKRQASEGRTSSRNVRDYCIGKAGGAADRPKRPQALTYGALAFRKADGTHLTLGIAMSAKESERNETVLARFVAVGVQLGAADFCEATPEGAKVRAWPELRRDLEARCAAAGGTLAVHQQAEQFVADYLKRLSETGRPVQAKQFLKAVSMAVSFQPIESASEFVRTYILERDDVGIGELRKSIATYREAARLIAEQETKLARLGEVRSAALAHAGKESELSVARWCRARAILGAARMDLVRNRRELAAKRTELEGLRAESGDRRSRRAALDARVADSARAVAQSGSAAWKARLEGEVAGLDRDRRDASQAVDAWRADVSRAVGAAERHRADLASAFGSSAAALDLLRKETVGKASESWPVDPARLQRAIADMTSLPDLASHLAAAASSAEAGKAALGADADDLAARVRSAASRGAAVGRETADLLDDLERLGAKPRLLCALVEVVDPEWRLAAEALLGRDREAIIVAPEHTRAAFEHLKRNRQRYRTCKIANTNKIDPDDVRSDPSSLAAVLKCHDRYAAAYVKHRIGGVRRAETLADLNRKGRAVMRDGLYDDGLAVSVRTLRGSHDYLLGTDVAGKGAEAMAGELRRIGAERQRLDRLAAELRDAAEAMRALDRRRTGGASLVAACDAVQAIDEAIADKRQAIEDGADGDDASLAAALDALKAEQAALDGEEREGARREGALEAEISAVLAALGGGERKEGSAFRAAHALSTFRSTKTGCDPSAAKAEYRRLLAAQAGSERAALRAAEARAEALEAALSDAFDALFRALGRYARECGEPIEVVRSDPGAVAAVTAWAERRIAEIETVSLVAYRSQMEEAAAKMTHSFQHHFVSKLADKLDGVRNEVEALNRVLAAHRFHYERYRFKVAVDAAYAPIVALVEEARHAPEILLPLFGQAGEDGRRHAAALDRIRAILTDETADFAQFEDYRNYFTFDLEMVDDRTGARTNLAHRRAVGSGAEKQVPFYVTIGAALSQAWRGAGSAARKAEGRVGIALFDEAFNKLDGKQQNLMLEFYDSLGLQPVIAMPYDRRAALYQSMDTFVEVYRTDNLVEVEAKYLTAHARAEMRKADPANAGIEGVRAAMAKGVEEAA